MFDIVVLFELVGVVVIGVLFDVFYWLLCDDFEVLVLEFDLVVEIVLENGVIGVWMIGGGFGGVVIVFVLIDGVLCF